LKEVIYLSWNRLRDDNNGDDDDDDDHGDDGGGGDGGGVVKAISISIPTLKRTKCARKHACKPQV
jgi:hypothetical protein